MAQPQYLQDPDNTYTEAAGSAAFKQSLKGSSGGGTRPGGNKAPSQNQSADIDAELTLEPVAQGGVVPEPASSDSQASTAAPQASPSASIAGLGKAGGDAPAKTGPVKEPQPAQKKKSFAEHFANAKGGIRDRATDGGLSYAAQALKEKQKDKNFQHKYGIAGDMASKALDKAQEHRSQGGQIGLKDAGKIAKQAAVASGKERLKRGAVQQLQKQIAKHPELAGNIGKLAEDLGQKKLDLSGRGVDKQLFDAGAQALARKGLQQAAKGAATAGTRQLANQALPVVGAISAGDAARGIGRGAKELKEGHAIKAAEKVVAGVAKSVLVTLFRASYEWYVIGLTWGLSLIVTFIVGNLLLLVPNRGMAFYEKLGVVALDFLVFFFVLFSLIGIVVIQCSIGPVGWAIWLASFVSDTANTFNDFCKYFSVFQQIKNIVQ